MSLGMTQLQKPSSGSKITFDQNGKMHVPNQPILPFIEGDGVGPDIWKAAQRVFDAAVEKAYKGQKKVVWFEVLAGEKAMKAYGEMLPQETLDALKEYAVSIKGPLTTPVGEGFRSINVSLRQIFDLYACVRPIRYFEGVPAPVKEPQKIDMIVFRENTEDVYAGIEWKAGSVEATKVIEFLKTQLRANIRPESAIGIKPISEVGSKRLIRAAFNYAIEMKKNSVTLVHKGNIQKFTEGAFYKWGYELAEKEYPGVFVTEKEVNEKYNGKIPSGKIVVKDRIADSMFQQALLRPEDYQVLATTNLNGDYLSDALIAQVGGLGLGPGANIGEKIAIFEATHGSAPKYAGQDKVNPGSVILSGCMMFDHLGWTEVSAMITRGLEKAISNKTVTYDLERQMKGATLVSCSGFAKEIIKHL